MLNQFIQNHEIESTQFKIELYVIYLVSRYYQAFFSASIRSPSFWNTDEFLGTGVHRCSVGNELWRSV